MAEDVVRDVRRETLPVFPGDAGLLGELTPDVRHDPLPHVRGVHVCVEQLRPEVRDHCEMDAILHVREWVPVRGDG